jgi:amidase
MIGVMGVAPPNADTISTMPAGIHGGNLDNPYNTIGSTLYLNVFHPGALFSVGDVHASQGDGEICGTGVEVGAHIVLSFQVLTQPSLDSGIQDTMSRSSSYPCRFPITETQSSFMTYGIVLDDIPSSTVVACDEASKLLQHQWCFTAPDAYIFLGVCGHLGLCQANHPDVNNTPIARMVIPKIDACPRPFARQLYKKDHDVDSNG